MAAGPSRDWITRLAESMRDHEGERSAVGGSLPRYEILGEISRGGMGIVYRAWDPHLGREVALKVLLEHAASTPDARDRFQRESQLAARLTHPHIVPVYDSGVWNGQMFLAMQLLEGPTLGKAGLDLRATLEKIRDAARALDYAHAQGIVHRDVKPSNLMLDRQGRVYVTDFGLARKIEGTAKLTLSGVVMGTAGYMSPEQAQGLKVDARSDVYSLGATLYDLATGQPPFTAADAMSILLKAILKDPPRPRRHNPALPRDVETIILKAMDKEPARRYPTAGALADDLQRYLDGDPILARPPGLLYLTKRRIARHPGAAAATVLLLIVLAGGGYVAGDYAQARREYLLGLAAPDPERQKIHFEKSARWVKDARDRLARLGAQPAAEAVRRFQDREKERQHLDALFKQGKALFREENLPGLLETVKALETHALQHEDLEPVRSGHLSELRPDLAGLEFELDLRSLARSTDRAQAERLLAKLSADRFSRVKGRSSRLGEALLEAGGTLTARQGAAARPFVDGLRERFPEIAAKLEPPVRALEVEADLKALEGLAARGEEAEFEPLFRRLAAEASLSARLSSSALALGGKLYDQGRFEPASRWLTRAHELGCRQPGLFERRGLAFLRLSRWEDAERDHEAFRAASVSGTRSPAGFWALFHHKARQDLDGGRWTSALGHLQRAFEIGAPGDAEKALLHHDYGRARFREDPRRAPEALKDLEAAWALDPKLRPHEDYVPAVLACVRELRWPVAPDRARSAVELLGTALGRIAPGHPDLLLERARMRRRVRDLTAAEQDADAALKAGSTAERHFVRGQIRAVQGRIPEAVEDLDRAEQEERGKLPVLYWRGVCHYRRYERERAPEQLRKALADLERSLPLGLADAFCLKASIHLELNEPAAAEAAATEALGRSGTLTEDEYAASRSEELSHTAAEAAARLRRDAFLYRGKARSGKDLKGCVDDCTEAVELDRAYPWSYFTRGLALCRLEKHAEARSDFEKAESLFRDPDWKKKAADRKRICDGEIEK
jgi:predicted Ser/Thr protein kinase